MAEIKLTGRVYRYGPGGQVFHGDRQHIKVERQPPLLIAMWRLWRDYRRARRVDTTF